MCGCVWNTSQSNTNTYSTDHLTRRTLPSTETSRLSWRQKDAATQWHARPAVVGTWVDSHGERRWCQGVCVCVVII